MQIKSKGLVQAVVVVFVLATAPFAVLAQQFKAPPPPDCTKQHPDVKQKCEAQLKAHGMCKAAQSAPAFGECMSKNRAFGTLQNCAEAQYTDKGYCEALVKVGVQCAATAKHIGEYWRCLKENRPFQAPLPPNCAAVPPENKAACLDVVKKRNACAAAAKSGPEYSACMQKQSEPPAAGPGTPPAAGSGTPPAIAPGTPPGTAGFKAPPPPDCTRARPEAKRRCYAEVNAHAMCTGARSDLEFAQCMQKNRAFVPPPAPSCATVRAEDKAHCETVVKVHTQCTATAKNQGEFGECMQKSTPFRPPPQQNCAFVPTGHKAACLDMVKKQAACAAAKSVPEYGACMQKQSAPPVAGPGTPPR
jgi:hypothetical protein